MTVNEIPTPSAGWTVTSQIETTEAGPNSLFVSGRRVTFRTAAGNTGSVFIADADYSVQTVRNAIRASAAQIDAVGALTE